MIRAVKAGKLCHRVFLRQRIDAAATAKGDQPMTYEAPTTSMEPDAYASIEPLVGRELIVARGLRADVSHKIELRGQYGAELNATCRIYWYNGVEFETYMLGPAVDKENRQILVSFYAYRVR